MDRILLLDLVCPQSTWCHLRQGNQAHRLHSWWISKSMRRLHSRPSLKTPHRIHSRRLQLHQRHRQQVQTKCRLRTDISTIEFGDDDTTQVSYRGSCDQTSSCWWSQLGVPYDPVTGFVRHVNVPNICPLHFWWALQAKTDVPKTSLDTWFTQKI